MSVVEIAPGDMFEMDPGDKRVVLFNYDRNNLATGVQISGTPTVVITSIKQNGGTALTSDSASVVGPDNRKFKLRLIATGTLRGDKYRVNINALTNESPAQNKEYSVYVNITDH